jgi:hypothetical protein
MLKTALFSIPPIKGHQEMSGADTAAAIVKQVDVRVVASCA